MRIRLANATGISSDRSSAAFEFEYANDAKPSEFRTPEISQRGSPPYAPPLAFRPLPPPSTPVRVGAL